MMIFEHLILKVNRTKDNKSKNKKSQMISLSRNQC